MVVRPLLRPSNGSRDVRVGLSVVEMGPSFTRTKPPSGIWSLDGLASADPDEGQCPVSGKYQSLQPAQRNSGIKLDVAESG